MEVTTLCTQNDSPTSDIKAMLFMLQTLLDTLHGSLKYVSDVVRKALQVICGQFDNIEDITGNFIHYTGFIFHFKINFRDSNYYISVSCVKCGMYLIL